MRNRGIRSAILFLGMVSVLTPLQADAAEGSQVTKEKVFVTESKDDYGSQVEFEQEIREGKKRFVLKDVTYEVLDIRYLDQLKKTTETTLPPSESLSDNGQEYKLVDSIVKEKKVEKTAEQMVYAYEEYDHPITVEMVPDTKMVSSVNRQTGKAENVQCNLTGITPAGTAEIPNVLNMAFQDYDAAYYEWNGIYIPRNEQEPALAGYERQLLESVGASDASRIIGLSWAGEPYLSVDGVLCRDAVADVRQTVQLYRAEYQGKIPAIEENETVYQNVYEAPDKEGRIEYEVRATGIYVEQKAILPYILTGAGILLLIGLLVAVLMIIADKKGKRNGST